MYYIDWCQFTSVLSPLPIRRWAREKESARIFFILNVHYYFTHRRTTMVIPRQIIIRFRFAPKFRLFFRVPLLFCDVALLPRWDRSFNVAPITISHERKLYCGNNNRRNSVAVPKMNHTGSLRGQQFRKYCCNYERFFFVIHLNITRKSLKEINFFSFSNIFKYYL